MTDIPPIVPLTHLDIALRPDPMRTVIRPFLPADPDGFVVAGHPRAERIIARVLAIPPGELHLELDRVRQSLDQRHRDVPEMLERRFEGVTAMVPAGAEVSADQRTLIGAYLSAEYSFEAAALFNPSAVPHPDQSNLPEGAMRIVVSLRGIGEGHLSSVTFRTGIWAADGSLAMDPASETAVPPMFDTPEGWHDGDTIQLDCRGSREPSETVLFPVLDSQSRGIEDLRLTPFVYPGRPKTYAGTYTALGSAGIRQELLQTDNFRTFKMHPVKGDLANAKGMALFPRQVGGRFLSVTRQDNENLWLATSDDVFTWEPAGKLLDPKYPWEIVQMGNCGSPLEIAEGWLLLTHGVGVVRNYAIGAALLDRDDPSKVLGRLPRPLMEPGPEDRDGYVPNVVYSCGGIVRDRTLLLPYGIADNYAGFATVSVDDLLGAMEAP
ncbi:glycoside hydrolase family 130 protein [Sphingomonas sp.]|uniref:glycoside hydrolase family 130 protein n=1 Tax=Sphingomonas sp. TaxID=28214 RepID=UPI0035BC1739